MKKDNIEGEISKSTASLIDMASDICWNKISRNCEYITSEIKENVGANYSEIAHVRKKANKKKEPKSLTEVAKELQLVYENLYDINLLIYKSLKEKTIIEIRYYLKTSLEKEFYSFVKENKPMLHCKVATPPYREESKKFDVNWELGGLRHKWNKFWLKTSRN